MRVDTIRAPVIFVRSSPAEGAWSLLRRRVSVLLSLACAVAGAAVLSTAGTATAAPAAPPATAGKTYVALGDSYAAGYGLPAPRSTPTGQPVPGCEQTTGDYPHLLAAKLGLTLTDVACSGAVTDDFYSPQSVSAGPNPPAQLDVFKTIQPDLVTITIGGNDLGFSSIANDCLAASPNGFLLNHPSFNSCKDYYTSSATGNGQASDPYKKLSGVIAKVKAAVAAVHQAAPKAKIAVIAYPAIAPDVKNTPATGCFVSLEQSHLPKGLPSVLPFTDIDIPYLQVLQQQLDAGIGQAATALGASYADIYPSSLAHSACQPENTRWVEPVIPGDGGTNVLHPNLAGTTAMANALAPLVQTLLTPAPSSTPASASTVSGSGSASAPASGSAAAASDAPLANTGTTTAVGRTILLGVSLIGLGAALLVVVPGLRRRRGAHR